MYEIADGLKKILHNKLQVDCRAGNVVVKLEEASAKKLIKRKLHDVQESD